MTDHEFVFSNMQHAMYMDKQKLQCLGIHEKPESNKKFNL